MRHGHGLRKLNRTSAHRLAMLREHDELAHRARGHQDHRCPKARELRRVIEPMITLAKGTPWRNRRLARSAACATATASPHCSTTWARFKVRPADTRIPEDGLPRWATMHPMALAGISRSYRSCRPNRFGKP